MAATAMLDLLWFPEVSAIDSQNSREIASFGDDNDDVIKTKPESSLCVYILYIINRKS